FAVVVGHGSSSFRLCRLHHGGAYAGISAATAEVSSQPVLDLLRRGFGMLVKKRLGRHHEPRRAEAALLRVIVDECLLYGMEPSGFAQPFHGGDLVVLR